MPAKTKKNAIPATESDRLLRASEVAVKLGVGMRTVWKLISTGTLASVRLHGTSSVRVKSSEIDRYVSDSEKDSARKAG